MNTENGNDDCAETIHIDIQDTVSATVDNKLEYTASTQGPSFADLFTDVKVTSESGDGDTLNPFDAESLREIDVTSDEQAKQNLQNDTNNSEGMSPNQSTNLASPCETHTSTTKEIAIPPIIPLSQMVDLDSQECQSLNTENNGQLQVVTQEEPTKEDTQDEVSSLQETSIPTVQTNTTDTVHEVPDNFAFQPVSEISNAQATDVPMTRSESNIVHHVERVGDNIEIQVGDDKELGKITELGHIDDKAGDELDDGVDLNELLQAQVKHKQHDSDDEFAFDSPEKKLESHTEGIQKAENSTIPLTIVPQKPVQTEVKEPLAITAQQEPHVISIAADATKPDTTIEQSATEHEDSGNEAEDEWAHIQTVTPSFGDASLGKADGVSAKIISYSEALEVFLDSNLDQHKGQIIRGVQRSAFKRLTHALFGPPKLNRDFAEQRDQYLCMTQYSFDNSADHCRILQTLNKRLTGAKFDCPRTGSHWEHIGFQGNDPVTDLRGCGMLGLLQLLYITTTPKYLPLTRDIYRLSVHETQNFPFCIMGINMTRLSIVALREDGLNKEINRQRGEKDLLTYMMQFYMATFYRLYSIWKSQHKTIADTGFVMRDLEAYIKKNPARLLADLETRVSSSNAAMAAEASLEPAIQFSAFNDD